MNILFLHSSRHDAAPWKDGSTRYRCYHLAEAIQRLGHIADVCSLHQIKLDSLHRYNVVCVLRPDPSRKLDKLLKLCLQLDIHTVADVDDLIFVAGYASQSPSVVNGQASESAVRERFDRHAQAMQQFTEIMVATEPLANAWEQVSGRNKALIVPNGLSERWLKQFNAIKSSATRKIRRITYLPGSSSHDKDFQQIAAALVSCLAQYPDCELQILGSLTFDWKKLPVQQLTRKAWTDYYNLPSLIANSTVTLAPLAPSQFTFAKSHIKFIESAAFGTPAICSPNHDLCRHSVDGLHIANTPEQWLDSLRLVLDNPEDQKEQGSKLISYALSHCTALKSAQQVLNHWQHVSSTDHSHSAKLLPAASSAS